MVRVGNSFSSTLTLSTGAPQGCVLSPLLYSLFTHDCVARHTSNTIFKFADDTTILGLITDGDETAYRDEVSALSEWCYHNNLSLNISKTKEVIVDYRKLQRGGHSPLYINGAEVERVSSVRFLGVHLTDDLTWSLHTNKAVRSARQLLFFLCRLRKFGLSPDHPHQLLQMHHREHPHGLHHCLVRQLYCLRPQGPEESGEDSGVHHRQQTSRPAGHLPVPLPEENPEDPVGL